MAIPPETLVLLSHLLHSPAGAIDLPPALETELLLKGAVVSLQEDGSGDAVEILLETAHTCPIDPIRALALASLDILAQEGNPLALQALYTLAIERNVAAAREKILQHSYQSARPPRQVIFDMLSGQYERFHKMDPGYGQVTEFFLSEAETDLQERILVAAGKAGLTDWITIVDAARAPTEPMVRGVIDRYTAFQPAERRLALRLFSDLAEAGEQADLEAICDLFVRYEDREALAIALDKGYVPQDSIQRALFLFLSEQWEAYETFDFDHRLLVAAYETSDNAMRKRVLDISRRSGQVEWFQNLSGTNRQRWLRDLSDADWDTTIRSLAGANRWDELWRLTQLASPLWSAKILGLITDSGWLPDRSDEQQELNLLQNLAREAVDSPLAIRPSRSFSIPSIDDLTCMALSPDGKILALGSSSNAIHLWQLADIPIPRETLYGAVAQTRALAFSSDGEFLVSSVGDNSIRVYRWEDSKAVKTLEGHTGLVRSLVISPDSRSLYSAGFDGTVRSWRFPYGPEVKVIARSEGEYFGLALSPDGDTLVAGGADRSLDVYGLPEGNLLRQLAGHQATVTTLAAAPTTQFVASYSRDKTIRVWNTVSGRQIQSIDYGPDVVTGLCIHPNEQVLASAGYRGQIHLWNLSTGKALFELVHHKRAVIGLALNADGNLMISASADGSVTVWNLEIFLQIRQPVETAHPNRAQEIQKMLEKKTLTPPERRWLAFTQELLRWRARFDVEIEGPHTISIGEFDIQL